MAATSFSPFTGDYSRLSTHNPEVLYDDRTGQEERKRISKKAHLTEEIFTALNQKHTFSTSETYGLTPDIDLLGLPDDAPDHGLDKDHPSVVKPRESGVCLLTEWFVKAGSKGQRSRNRKLRCHLN